MPKELYVDFYMPPKASDRIKGRIKDNKERLAVGLQSEALRGI